MKPSMSHLRPILIALPALALAPPAGRAQAGAFVGASVGPSLLREEGHAPPLCCYEREMWHAPGARVGARLGYGFSWPLRVSVDLGAAAYQVVGQDHLQLRLFSPDAAAIVAAQLRFAAGTVDLGVGVGWRYFSGTAHHTIDDNRAVSAHAADLRATIAVSARAGARHTLGGELTVAKVILDQLVTTLSFVIAWDLL
jgi:hypothetical protein